MNYSLFHVISYYKTIFQDFRSHPMFTIAAVGHLWLNVKTNLLSLTELMPLLTKSFLVLVLPIQRFQGNKQDAAGILYQPG